MTERNSILETDNANVWLRQFEPSDQLLAADLLKRFILVSRDEFSDGLRNLVLDKFKDSNGTIGLYAERELRKWNGVPNRLFKETRTKVKRAYGVGPRPVEPTKLYKPEVGSEGIVAQIITDLCREFPKKFKNHPGPDAIRANKIRHFSIVTDLIASGTRARNYLIAAWKVRSVRSWWSSKHIKFSVLAYASTRSGERWISRHPCRPEVQVLIPCPTMRDEFESDTYQHYRELCEKYDPTYNRQGSSQWPWLRGGLGYDNTGALIAFAHGAPNNTPEIFHKSNKRGTWIPLFTSRVTAGLPSDAFGTNLDENTINHRLIALGQESLAEAIAQPITDKNIQKRIILLVALLKSPRTLEVLAKKTSLNMLEVSRACHELFLLGWINDQKRLTDAGYRELKAIRETSNIFKKNLKSNVDQDRDPYYPSALRFPF